jgi:outer membrane biosynthesis protein TonB
LVVARFFDSFKITDGAETNEVELAMRNLPKRCMKTVLAPSNEAQINDKSVSGDVLNGRAIRLVTPTYPKIARAAHASGPVNVQVLIDDEGKVIAAHAVSGHPLLFGAAVAAARESEFTPTTFKGEPACVNGIIVYNFVSQ